MLLTTLGSLRMLPWVTQVRAALRGSKTSWICSFVGTASPRQGQLAPPANGARTPAPPLWGWNFDVPGAHSPCSLACDEANDTPVPLSVAIEPRSARSGHKRHNSLARHRPYRTVLGSRYRDHGPLTLEGAKSLPWDRLPRAPRLSPGSTGDTALNNSLTTKYLRELLTELSALT